MLYTKILKFALGLIVHKPRRGPNCPLKLLLFATPTEIIMPTICMQADRILPHGFQRGLEGNMESFVRKYVCASTSETAAAKKIVDPKR